MTRPSHRSRNPFGSCANTAPASTSSVASDGAFTGRQASGSDAKSAIIVMYTVIARSKAMSRKVLIVTITAAALLAAIAPAAAQNETSPVAQPGLASPPRHVRHRIEINPRPLLYRRCTDWYELQYRPSGTVLY